MDEKDRVTILSYEYATLRNEIIARTGHGYLLLAIGAPLLAGFVLHADLKDW